MARRGVALGSQELSRAARLLAVRGRRESTGLFAGSFASAFRGSGLEYEESRAYVPGDDVTSFDWSTTARTGVPYVKTFRPERNQTVLFALDVSASMRFGTAGASKLATAVHAAALLAAAAVRAGDRVGLVAFDDAVRATLAPGRGTAHAQRIFEAAQAALAAPGGGTRLAVALDALRALARRRAVLVVLSDFLDPELGDPRGGLDDALVRTARTHELIAATVRDAREAELVAAGGVRIEDPERPGAGGWLPTSSRRVRRRYREAALARERRLAGCLRRAGADLVALDTAASPLQPLARFLHERAVRRVRGVA